MELKNQLTDIRALVLKSNFLATKSVPAITDALRNTPFHNLGNRLGSTIDRLDFDKALEILDELVACIRADKV